MIFSYYFFLTFSYFIWYLFNNNQSFTDNATIVNYTLNKPHFLKQPI